MAVGYLTWSIPTRVGNTMLAIAVVGGFMVHPHACGEYCNYPRCLSRYYGPSPRVWGILFRIPVRSARLWSIPTRVGNTL